MTTTTATANESPSGFATMLRKPPVLGLMIIAMMFCEKMLAHTYTALTIYVLPSPWKFIVPGVIGLIGLILILRGMGKDEVKGTLMGYIGMVLVWMSWFESGLPMIAHRANIPAVIPEDGNVMAGLLGEHIILQASGIYCVMALFFIMLNKDVRCRMLLWIKRNIGLAEKVGKPTQGYRPNVARVAAFEYFFVTWFMYVLMLLIVDPRSFGLQHPVTIGLSLLVCAWGVYLIYKSSKQREVGLAVRYGIGAAGVAWFIPETLAFYELFHEFYLRVDQYPISMLIIFIVYVVSFRVLWTTPINSKTQRSL